MLFVLLELFKLVYELLPTWLALDMELLGLVKFVEELNLVC